MRTIRTTIDLDATPSTAWAVLADFGAHAEWNPFMRRIEGEPTVGSRLVVELAPPGGRSMTFRPRVTAAEPERVFEWLGHLGVPGLFDGRHRFELVPLPDGRTRLVHGESFRGLLVGPAWRSMAAPTRAGFEQFNAAFADRCRAASSTSSAPRAAEPQR